MLINFRDKLRSGGKTSFSRQELNMLLSVYGIRVQNGEWKDYAIDSSRDMAVFSIFKSSTELPLYSIIKIASSSMMRPTQYVLNAGGKIIKQTDNLREIIQYLEEQG